MNVYWGKPVTNMYRTKFVLAGYNVYISGDIGEAVYSFTCSTTLENIKGFNLGYFTEKLTAFCEGGLKKFRISVKGYHVV